MIAAQRQYGELLKGATMVLMLSTMLHSIATGNMIPAAARTISIPCGRMPSAKVAAPRTSSAWMSICSTQ